MSTKSKSSGAKQADFPTIDALLSQYAKNLQPGESVSIPLYKGRQTITTIDPLQASQAKKAAAAIGAKEPAKSVVKRHEISFPRLLKFIETVEKPNFQNVGEYQDGRLYTEDIPKVKDESDDEDAEEAPTSSRKKRWRRNQPPKQQWILQPSQEYIQKFKIKQFKQKDSVAAVKLEQELNSKLSKRYHGLPESNHSAYVIFEASPPQENGEGGSIKVMPMHGFTNFTQPSKFKTLSMQQAEQAISGKNMTRYMMHQGGNSHVKTNQEGSSVGNTRSRLLGKLTAGGLDEDNDVMGDICFREPTRSNARSATTELLNGIGDADLKMDSDGILGGANDSEFGGKRRFGRMGQIKKEEDGNAKKQKNSGGDAKVGNEAAAMQDDFYQRDVGAEYEELDYDVNEQFDDDDVDVGAEEVVMDEGGGFVADIDSDSDGDDDEDGDELDMSGFDNGFATSAGTKAMIAKANGEGTQPPVVAAVVATTDRKGNMSDANATSGSDRSEDETSMGASSKGAINKASTTAESTSTTTAKTVQLDENGLRIITKDAVRREIWLHNGSVKMRTLAKVFKISGKSAKERQERFKTVCKELCNVNNGVFILKQHYSKME